MYQVNREEYQIEGRNAVLAALMAGRPIDKVYIAQNEHGLGKIIALAKEKGAVISTVPRAKLAEMALTSAHQGVIASCSPMGYVKIEEMLRRAEKKGEEPFLIALDEIVDPHNLGAILRTANAAGAHGVIITKHRSVGLNATVAKTSAGAVEYTKVARVTNLGQTLSTLKEAGLWIYGAAGQAANTYTSAKMTGPICLVIGNEGSGISKHITRICDFLVSIPMYGEITSLNASVASALLMYEIVRQRRMINDK